MRNSAQALLLADAEDGPQDHLERDRLHAGPQRERLTDRPPLDLAGRDLRDQVAVALHRLAVEGRQQQLALAHVVLAVERQQRELAEHRLERPRVRGARVERRRVSGEDLLHERRIGEVDHPPEAGEREAEHVAVAPAVALQEPDRVA